MQAVAVFPKERAIRIVNRAEPDLSGPTDVKVRVLDVGICGTDKEICTFAYGTPPGGDDYLVLGHECLGEVVEIGAGVSTLKVGDLVVPTVRRPCGHDDCPSCAIGRQDFCYTGEFTERGIRERHGYMTQFIVDDERFMVRIPRELREVAVLVEPLTIAEKGLIQVWQVQQRLPWSCPHAPNHKPGVCHHAVVLGAGPVGLLGAMAFSAAGFTTYVYSRESEDSPQGRLVRSIGAHFVSAADTPVDRLMERVGTIDVVYEAAGASRLSFEVLRQLGPNAAFVFTGVPGLKGASEVDTDFIMRNMVLQNQVLLGTVNAGRDAFEAAVRDLGRFMEMWPDAVRSLITRHPLSRCEDLLLGRVGGIKNVLAIG